jgi:hypothetical protein
VSEKRNLLAEILGVEGTEGGKRSRATSPPMPEVVDDDPTWKVVTHVRKKEEGGVDLVENRIAVSSGLSPLELRVRLHELGHIAITPKVKLKDRADEIGAIPRFLNALEDARINARFERRETLKRVMADAPLVSKPEGEMLEAVSRSWGEYIDEVVKDKRSDDPHARSMQATAALMYLAARGTPEEQVARKFAKRVRVPMRQLNKSLKRIRRESATFDLVEKEAVRLSELFRLDDPVEEVPPALDEGRLEGLCESVAPLRSGGETDTGEDGKELTGTDSKGTKPDERDRFARFYQTWRGMRPQDIASDPRVRWGKMAISEPELTVTMKKPPRWNVRVPVNRDDGGRVRALHRIAIDGKVFRRKKKRFVRRRDGTLLIDTSGSMAISPYELDMAIRQMPHGTIAIYGGDGGSRGTLRIVAKNGKRVEKIMRPGGGNQVDGPALRWLTEQAKPRIWVSDGHVTGTQDRMTSELVAEAIEIVDHGGIYHIHNLPELLSELHPNGEPTYEYGDEAYEEYEEYDEYDPDL